MMTYYKVKGLLQKFSYLNAADYGMAMVWIPLPARACSCKMGGSGTGGSSGGSTVVNQDHDSNHATNQQDKSQGGGDTSRVHPSSDVLNGSSINQF